MLTSLLLLSKSQVLKCLEKLCMVAKKILGEGILPNELIKQLT
jgi:hypothetical protein